MDKVPSPDISPSIQIKKWIENPVELLKICEASCGETFSLELGALGTTVFFSNPQAIREIMALPANLYKCSDFNQSYRHLMGEKSLFLQDFPIHKQKRKLLMPFFHGESIKHYAQVIADITKSLVEIRASENPFQLRLLMHEIALQVILTIVFGDLKNKTSQLLIQIFRTQILQDFGSWTPWARLGKRRQLIGELINLEIKQKQNNLDSNNPDLLSLLLLATDEEGEKLTSAEIQDHIFTLLIAGIDPTAIGMTWAIHAIHQNSAIKNKLQLELDQFDTNINHPLEYTKLPYLTATCQEALRLTPPLAVTSGRKLTQTVEIGGYKIAENTTVIPCVYLLHRRQDIYPQPDIFQPERFLENNYSTSEYIPFGGGNRMCIGWALAQMELKIVLATILSDWKFENLKSDQVKPIRHGTIMAPSNQVQLNLNTLTLRKNSN